MSIKISQDYSSVVLNQNQAPSGSLDITDGAWRYQEFFLPPNFPRGSKVPSLSGLQVFSQIPSGNAEFAWTIQVRSFGVGWETLAEGIQAGVQESGNEVWGSVYFPSVDISEVWENRFRIGIFAISGLQELWFSSPNPYANQFARATDAQETPLLYSGAQYSFCFRILGLTAEEGTDFLGNRYRSLVVTNEASSTDSVNGDPNQAWMSKPNPSRFAVEALYFDLRPTPEGPTYGLVNFITDPNYEGTGSIYTDNLTTHSAASTPAIIRGRSLKVSAASPSNSYVSVTLAGGSPELVDMGGKTIFLSYSTYHPASWVQPSGATKVIGMGQISLPGVSTSISSSIPRDQWVRRGISLTGIDPTKDLVIQLPNQGTGDVFFSGVMLTIGDHGQQYADGGFTGWSWGGIPHASLSIQHITQDALDEPIVVDRILIDPQTPGIWCSAYYSNDGFPGTTDDEWDSKNWKRINENLNLKERQSYALPSPVSAKYMKLEFTHLQPQQYSPGNFTQPIVFKKHPLSVVQYFMARLAVDSQTTNQTVANKVGVTYSSLDLLYNYYLDDINREPEAPSKTPAGLSTSFDEIMDISMLGKISTRVNPYLESTQGWDSGSVLGEVSLLNKSQDDYPSEFFTTAILQDKSDYVSVRDPSIAFESDYPVMFFYLDGSHEYREVSAKFTFNRAYFAGIREVAFLRDQYTATYDSSQYLENGSDTFNAERSEFATLGDNLVVPE